MRLSAASSMTHAFLDPNPTSRKRQILEENPENFRNEGKFGPIPGIPVGATWKSRQVSLDLSPPNALTTGDATREDCAKARVHTSTTAGISGSKDGACSIMMSGGYPDADRGEEMWVTGPHFLAPLISHQFIAHTEAPADMRVVGTVQEVEAARKSQTSPSSTATIMH